MRTQLEGWDSLLFPVRTLRDAFLRPRELEPSILTALSSFGLTTTDMLQQDPLRGRPHLPHLLLLPLLSLCPFEIGIPSLTSAWLLLWLLKLSRVPAACNVAESLRWRSFGCAI